MKYLKKFNESLTPDELNLINLEIEKLLLSTELNRVRVNPDGTVDVGGNASFKTTKIDRLNIKFGTVGGSIWCTSTGLKSLEGFPNYVGKDLNLRESTKLTSLQGGPKEVGGEVFLWGCKSLTSLEGGPHYVGGLYFCGETPKLSNLIGCPSTVGGIQCTDSGITSLEGLPERHDGDLTFYNCSKLTTLQGISKLVGGKVDFSVCKNLWDARPLKDCTLLKNNIKLEGTPLESLLHVFGRKIGWFKDSLDYNYIRNPIMDVDGKIHPTINLFKFKEALHEFDIDYIECSLYDDWIFGPKSHFQYRNQPEGTIGGWLFVDDRGKRINFHGEVLE